MDVYEYKAVSIADKLPRSPEHYLDILFEGLGEKGWVYCGMDPINRLMFWRRVED